VLLYPRQTILSTLGVKLGSWIQIFNPKPLVDWSIKQLKIINNSNILAPLLVLHLLSDINREGGQIRGQCWPDKLRTHFWIGEFVCI